MKYCSDCGAPVRQEIPAGDHRERSVCTRCAKIHYRNPRVVAGCLATFDNKVLLCRRAIEPRKGYWTLPGGFLELGESIEQGAVRETQEEAGAIVQVSSLYTLFNVLHVGQLSLFFLAQMSSSDYSAGEESLEVRLFDEDEIPWDELAFETIQITLEHYFSDRRNGQFVQRIQDVYNNHSLSPSRPQGSV